MKSFLLNKETKTPILRWGSLPDNYFFEGNIPEGYCLAVSPSNNYIILDVDVKNGKNGWNFIPNDIFEELKHTFSYKTSSGGSHIWLKYTGDIPLMNRATKEGIDLRTNKGYVRYQYDQDIRNMIPYIKETNNILNEWLQKLFS